MREPEPSGGFPALLPVLLLLAAGCASSEPMGEEFPPRPDEWPIAVFVTAGAPRSAVDLGRVGRPPGKRIGRFEVRAGPGATWRSAISKAKAEARDLGGDAILIRGGDEYYRVIRGYVYRRRR